MASLIRDFHNIQGELYIKFHIVYVLAFLKLHVAGSSAFIHRKGFITVNAMYRKLKDSGLVEW